MYYRKLEGETCYLSPVDDQASHIVAKWSNDLSIAIRTGDLSDMITLKVQEDYLQGMNQGGYGFYIVKNDGEHPIGIARLMRVDLLNRTAVMGIFICESNQNNGLGTDVTNMLLDFGFNVINLKNIMIETYGFNHRAIKVSKKCGFKEIGRRRKAISYGNKSYDLVYLDMLQEEFTCSKILNELK